MEDFTERVTIVDPEPDVRARSEAAMVLVEGEVEEGRDPAGGHGRGRHGAGFLGFGDGGVRIGGLRIGGDGGVRVAVPPGIEEGRDRIGIMRFEYGGFDGVIVVGVWFGGCWIQSLRHRRRGGGGGLVLFGDGDFTGKINEKMIFEGDKRKYYIGNGSTEGEF